MSSLTIEAFAKSLNSAWDLEDWLSWPPDVFALSSLFLKQTGVYKYTVQPPGGEPWPDETEWKKKLKDTQDEWYRWILGEPHKELPTFLKTCTQRLKSNWASVTIERIRQMTLGKTYFEDAWAVCRSILELHALADEACAGFGTPSGNTWTRDIGVKALTSLANMLLANTGSLSRLPKNVVQVLPKFRTPSVGMTLRSLSHNLTVHQTEVEVLWRAMPWTNIDENTINILIVPWPYEVKPIWFSPSSYSTKRESIERDRYFDYSGSDEDFSCTELLEMIHNAERHVHRVHMVIFPELALTKSNLESILDALAEGKERDKIPMVIAGVRSSNPAGLGNNSVILSTFFAGKWYQMKQDKHHRWKLEGKQIQQYNLGGVLTGSKDWWEAIEIPHRRLSILAPNTWLILCPLICEDLARLDPVSEIIRGIGPTLLIAILLDGPQLRERWSARYASVMADDPGTSVLTVSSLGFAERSLSPDRKSGSRTIALWKDQISGWQEIEVTKGNKAVVLTIAAHRKEEVTSDGRSDENSAAVFAFQGIHQINANTACSFENKKTSTLFSDELDYGEITEFSYFVDAILDSNNNAIDELAGWVLNNKSDDGFLKDLRPRRELWEKIHQRSLDEILKGGNEEPRQNLKPFVLWFSDLVKRTQSGEPITDSASLLKYFERLVECALKILERVTEESFLDDLEKGDPLQKLRESFDLPSLPLSEVPRHRRVRVYIYCCLAALWVVHKRLCGQRRKGQLGGKGAYLLSLIEGQLRQKYDKKWYEAMTTFGEE